MNVHPIGEKVLVLLYPPPERTAGGLSLPERAQERQGKGQVVAVGGAPLRPAFVQPDDIVYFALPFSERENATIRMDGKTLLFVGFSELIAVEGDEFLDACGQWLLVNPRGWKPETVSGLALPETVTSKRSCRGVVVSVGLDIPLGSVNDGDEVLFQPLWRRSHTILYQGRELLAILYDHLIGVVECEADAA
jgi:chaperonin GroES